MCNVGIQFEDVLGHCSLQATEKVIIYIVHLQCTLQCKIGSVCETHQLYHTKKNL